MFGENLLKDNHNAIIISLILMLVLVSLIILLEKMGLLREGVNIWWFWSQADIEMSGKKHLRFGFPFPFPYLYSLLISTEQVENSLQCVYLFID